ncbi:hypothetical protein BCR44DRAFT_26901 [Catenaria anguillulae PL171]|uniref:Conserved oligomeric Golgi complex subunit 7 n=1 Tax=Catenaria anguillulae PL171 TaxID=765915 RepID=A0A1Y2I359_9FUNG|nr:hypothetical protein BCR44DRAFT_26901 [Catenaria anguillulae PL171]
MTVTVQLPTGQNTHTNTHTAAESDPPEDHNGHGQSSQSASAPPSHSHTHSQQDVDAALAAVMAMALSHTDRFGAAKQHINKSLEAATASASATATATATAKTAKSKGKGTQANLSLHQVAQELSIIAAKAHVNHTQATAQLPTLHAQLTAAIAHSPSLATPISTQLESLLLSNPTAHSTEPICDPQLTASLSRLTSTRARIESARVALADLRRWSTLASTILATDPADAAQAFAAARDDLDRLATFLPVDEHERRVGVLADLKSQLWSRIAPKLDTALRTASSSSAAGDVAALYALAHKIGAGQEFVKQYCTVRTQTISSSSASTSPVLTALADTIEHDLATLPLLPPDRLPLSLALLAHALTTLTLPDDPTGDPAIIQRLDRLYSPTSTPEFTQAIHPLLVRIHGLPHRSSRLALAAIDTLFDRIPLTSADPAHIDTVWRSQVMPSALAVASKVIAQHAGVCGGLRVKGKDGLKATVRRTWEHMCARIGKVMARLHQLHSSVAGAGGQSKLVVVPEVMARYVAAVSMAAAVLDKAKVVEAQMDELVLRGGDGVCRVVAEYLASKEGTDEDQALGLIDLTTSVGASALNYAFEYLLAPVTFTLTQTVLSPLLKPTSARASASAANQPARPSTPISRTGTPQPSSATTSTPAPRATMVTALPQFSRSPTPAATALGEYLLQLPHHLHAFSTTTSAVPGARAFAFTDNMQSALGKLCQVPDGDQTSADLLEAVVLVAQLSLVHAVASRADPPHPSTSSRKSSDAASTHPGPLANASHASTSSTGVSHSASTGRLASLVSSTLSGLPSSLSMRAGLSEITSSSSSSSTPASATSPRVGRSFAGLTSPASDQASVAAALLAPMDTLAREQLAQDLAYLGNVFTALDCVPRCEWTYVLGLVERGTPTGGWDASRVASVLAEEAAMDMGNKIRVGKLSELMTRAAKADDQVAKWWAQVARVAASVFPPTAGAGGQAGR